MKKIIFFLSVLFGPLGLSAMQSQLVKERPLVHQATEDEDLDIQILKGNFEILFETFIDSDNQPALRNLATRVVTLWIDRNYRDTLMSDFGLTTHKTSAELDNYFELLFGEIINSEYLLDLGRPYGNKNASIFMIALQNGREDIFIRLLEYNLSCVLHGYFNIDIALNPNEMHVGKNLVHYSCLHGFTKSLFILQMLGADLTAPTAMGFTPSQLVAANVSLKRNIADNLILILTNKDMPEKTLNLDKTDVHFHSVVISLHEYNNSRNCVRPSCSSNDLILAWANSNSSFSLDESSTQDPTPEIADPLLAMDQSCESYDLPRTPTRSRASIDNTPTNIPALVARQSLSERSFHSIAQQSPVQSRYQLQHNLFWGQEFDQLEQEVNLPGQPMGSRACSENSAENFNATAVINKLQELEDIEEINEQVAMTSKKCCKCIIL